MSIYKLTPDDFEFFTLETNPKRTYTSSSIDGIVGSVNLFARRSTVEKDLFSSLDFSSTAINRFKDENIESIRQIAVDSTSSNISGDIESYLDYIHNTETSTRKQQKLEIYRFTPPFSFNSNFLRKSIIRTNLMPRLRTVYPRAHWNVTNYNCLNFFTASNLPEDAVMLYPNPVLDDGIGSNYMISGAFAFDFFIKPKYTTTLEGAHYKAGSIFHLSNSYCISLHTGSSKDVFGIPDKFRIGIQLGEDTNTSPSLLNSSTPAGPLTFFSTDNSLPKNAWSHVTVTWAGHNKNNGSGSLYINAVKDSTFAVTESLLLGHYTGSRDPSVLCIGNYYEGENELSRSLDSFFAADPSLREGLLELNGTPALEQPTDYDFTHPLNAEVYDLKLYDKYLTKDDVVALQSAGPSSLTNLRFYVPPFFTEESPYRQNVGTFGGELVTPFFEKDATTTTPFAAQMAFSCGGHYINLENYVRDFATGNFPRLWSLSGSAWTPPSTTILSANDFLYATGSIIRRLYQVLPCDNGGFKPNFDLLSPLSQSMFVNDLGNSELGVVTLNNIVNDSFESRAIVASGSILDDVLGARPDDLSTLPGNSLAILHRTRDSSSNQVVIFDISNMFYGMSIKPKSLVIRDPSPRFSNSPITIKDDGEGSLYRADCVSSSSSGADFGTHPTWASIGNVFYDEGLVVIKSPQLYFFGEEEYEIEFRGEQNIHMLTVSALARSMTQTSSSNPAYQSIPNDLANQPDSKAVYITGINIHDENLNVIMRSKLAQPVLKRSGDKILFKVRLDW